MPPKGRNIAGMTMCEQLIPICAVFMGIFAHGFRVCCGNEAFRKLRSIDWSLLHLRPKNPPVDENFMVYDMVLASESPDKMMVFKCIQSSPMK